MPSRPREKMSISDRAKQFAPFAALSGLDAALRQKEWEVEARQSFENSPKKPLAFSDPLMYNE